MQLQPNGKVRMEVAEHDEPAEQVEPVVSEGADEAAPAEETPEAEAPVEAEEGQGGEGGEVAETEGATPAEGEEGAVAAPAEGTSETPAEEAAPDPRDEELAALRDQHARVIATLRHSPTARLEYYNALKDQGESLSPEAQADYDHLVTRVKATPAAAAAVAKEPTVAEMSQEQVVAKVKALQAQGKDFEAMELLTDWKVERRIGPMQQRVETHEQRAKREQAERQQQAMQQQTANQYAETQKVYPDLIVPAANGKFDIKDPVVKKAFIELGADPLYQRATVRQVLERALQDTGKLGMVKAKTAPAAAPAKKAAALPPAKGKPPVKAQAAIGTGKKASAVPPGKVRVDVGPPTRGG